MSAGGYGWGDRLGRLGIEDDEATRIFTGGAGGKTGWLKGEVEHTPLAGGHRRKGEGFSGIADLFNGGFGGELEVAAAIGLEAVGVEEYAIVLFGFKVKNFSGDVLDGVKEFAVALSEEGSVRTGELDGDLRSIPGQGDEPVFKIEAKAADEEVKQILDRLGGECLFGHGVTFRGVWRV